LKLLLYNKFEKIQKGLTVSNVDKKMLPLFRGSTEALFCLGGNLFHMASLIQSSWMGKTKIRSQTSNKSLIHHHEFSHRIFSALKKGRSENG
jgi:hypothetical protein